MERWGRGKKRKNEMRQQKKWTKYKIFRFCFFFVSDDERTAAVAVLVLQDEEQYKSYVVMNDMGVRRKSMREVLKAQGKDE